LVRHRKTGAVLAMKRIDKQVLITKNLMKTIEAEKDILMEEESEYLVQGLYSFQDSEFLYFVMEYLPGGDFKTLISNLGLLSESDAAFYVAEMILAVNDLHKLGYIHR